MSKDLVTTNKETDSSSNATGPSTRSKRSKNGCVSCKNLKIKCTEEKPFCEYCLHTGRQCIYFQKPSVKIKVFKTKLGRPSRKRPKSKAEKNQKESNKIEELNSSSNSNSTSNSALNSNSNSTPSSISSNTPPELQLNYSSSTKHLNSPVVQLEITPFELQLLKFYLEFGADFFTFNVLKHTHDFWEFEVPQLWCQSDLIKNALYMLSSVRLLANYEESSFDSVHIEFDNDDLSAGSQIVTTKRSSSSASTSSNSNLQSVNLYDQAKGYLSKTYELMNMYQLMLGNGAVLGTDLASGTIQDNTTDVVGQLLVANLCVTVACGMLANDLVKFPIDPTMKDISHFKIFEMIRIFKQFQLILNLNYDYINGSKYQRMFGQDYSTSHQQPFIWSIHLRNYVLKKLDTLDILQISCLNLISRIEACCHKAIEQSYPMALIHPIREVFLDEDLLTAFEQGNEVVVKIMYYICSILGIFDFKLTKGCTVWNEIIEFHKERSFYLHDGKFENDWDCNLYNTLLARRECKILYDFNLIYYLGRPVEDFISGKIKLEKKSYPPVFF